MRRPRKPPAGSRPGTLVIPGGAPPPAVRLLDYSSGHLEEQAPARFEDLAAARSRSSVSWIDVQGLGDEALLRRIATLFEIHPLALADLVNVPQRPKVDAYEGHLLVIACMVTLVRGRVRLEQLGLVLTAGAVLTFQEDPGDVLDPVRARLRADAGMLRKAGPDYLLYALLDTLVDGYFPVVEALGQQLEDLEAEVIERPRSDLMTRLHVLRRDLQHLRRTLWSQREAFATLLREASPLLGEQARLHLRDPSDHALQVLDVVETYRETAVSLMDLYLSTLSHRLNEVIKLLTVMSSLFIPLTFIVGIYGMNFEAMPELHWRWGYPLVWALMLAVSAGLLLFFRRRGWLGGDERPVGDDAGDAARVEEN